MRTDLLQERIIALHAVYQVASADTIALLNLAKDSQWAARACVRSVTTLVESLGYALRQYAIIDEHGMLSDDDRAIISNKQVMLAENGDVRVIRPRRSALPLLRFTFAVIARTFKIDVKLDTSGVDWQRLGDTYSVRNRLTHPSVAGDFEVTNEELMAAGKVAMWYSALVLDCIDAIKATLVRRHDELVAEHDRLIEAAKDLKREEAD